MHRSTLLFLPIVNTLLLKSILTHSKLLGKELDKMFYIGGVGWARYKTVKNWAEVSVVARDTISVVYYSPAAN